MKSPLLGCNFMVFGVYLLKMLQLKYKYHDMVSDILKSRWKLLVSAVLLISMFSVIGLAKPVVASHVPYGCPGSESTGPPDPGTVCPDDSSDGGIKRTKSGEYECPEGTNIETCVKENPIVKSVINPLITLLGALVGVAVTLMIIVGGIQYGSSGGDPQAVANAKQKIKNAVIALLAFAFMWSFLQWIVPGGIF